MAGGAWQSRGVFGARNLLEPFRLGAIGFVARGAEHRGIEFRRNDGAGVIGMRGLGAVAAFAINGDVLALAFEIRDIRVACFAGLVPRKFHGFEADFREGVAAKVPILAKIAGNQEAAHHEENRNAGSENQRQPEKVP